jgi:hypothetical protein
MPGRRNLDFHPGRYPESRVLAYCAGCGCNHRTLWMDWTPEGTYRCVVCCRDGNGHHRDRLPQMYPDVTIA